MNLLQQALDADLYTRESNMASVIPTRTIFDDVKELAYLGEVDEVLRKGIEAAASGGPLPVGELT